MTRSALVVTVAALFLAGPLSTHAASGTLVSGGTLKFASNVGDIDLTGQSAFRLTSTVDSTGGRFDAASMCSDLDCPPGTVISLYARWSGLDLSGTAALQGQTYTLGSEASGGALGIVEFVGTVTAPDFGDATVVDVSAPFAFSGQLAYGDGQSQVEPLRGGGTATVRLTRSGDGTSWVFTAATYTMQKK